MMQLYGFWRSLATHRVRIALNLKGMQVPEIMIDLDRGEQHEPKFRKLNPMGAVPALILEDGTALTQSLAILEWIEETERLPPLLPKDPLARARARALCAITAADTHPLVVPRVQAYLGRAGTSLPAWRGTGTGSRKGLEAYEIAGRTGPVLLRRGARPGGCVPGQPRRRRAPVRR